jgi:YVTN family beta-propeller protein
VAGLLVVAAPVAHAAPVTLPPVWVANAPDLTSMTAIDPATNTVASVAGPLVEDGTAKPELSPDGTRLYLPQPLNGALMAVDTSTGHPIGVATMPGYPFSVALSPDGSRAYVPRGQIGHDEVWVIDTATMTQESPLIAGDAPVAVAITPDGKTGYVSNDNSGTVSVFDTATNTVSTTIAIGSLPAMLAITPDGSKVYALDEGSDEVSVISTASNTVVATIPVGDTPDDIAITPDGAYAYVTNVYPTDPTGTVSVIDTATDTVAATIPVGSRPYSVAITPDGNDAYVSQNDPSGLVTVIDTASHAVSTTVNVGGEPGGAAAAPDQAPAAALSATSAPVGQATAFDASASTVAFGTIVSYAWVFGDGATAVTGTPTTTHTYTHNGAFTASVTETDSAGTSVTRVFTGQMVSRNGGPSARASAVVDVPDATTTKLASSENPAAKGDAVTYTASVAAQLATSGTPTGTVSFSDGTSVISGCANVALANGQATCTVVYPATGTHAMTASYSGAATFLPSDSAPLGETVASCGKSLSGCNLGAANLVNAQLAGANLKGANLKDADLTGANLSGANLNGANLKGANLTDADLSGASLTGANLSSVIWSNTTCPDGTNSNADAGTCVGHL